MQAMNVLYICNVEAFLNLRYEYLKDFKALIPKDYKILNFGRYK